MKPMNFAVAAVIAALASGAQAQTSAESQIEADLTSKGFQDIDIDFSSSRIFVDAYRGGREFEVVYDRSTGAILASGWEDDDDGDYDDDDFYDDDDDDDDGYDDDDDYDDGDDDDDDDYDD